MGSAQLFPERWTIRAVLESRVVIENRYFCISVTAAFQECAIRFPRLGATLVIAHRKAGEPSGPPPCRLLRVRMTALYKILFECRVQIAGISLQGTRRSQVYQAIDALEYTYSQGYTAEQALYLLQRAIYALTKLVYANIDLSWMKNLL